MVSERLAPELVYGHENADVRFPLDVQREYGRAVESGLFDRIELCSTYETAGDEVVNESHYLFGVRDLPILGASLFFVAQW